MACGLLAILPVLSHTQESIRTFPYSQDFGANFNEKGSVFLQNWWWNKGGNGQIFQFNWQGRSDLFSLALLPDGTPPITAQLYLDLRGRKNTYLGFWAATLKNGGDKDLKKSYLAVSVSTNGGKDFGFEIPIGPAGGFPNQNNTFQYFQYPLPQVADGNATTVLRFSVWSEEGAQQPAIILLDDVRVAQAPSDVAPPFIVSLD